MSKKTTAEAEAVTQGSNIAFAPGKLDFSSTHGQALLGHEISHAASQARGESRARQLWSRLQKESRIPPWKSVPDTGNDETLYCVPVTLVTGTRTYF